MPPFLGNVLAPSIDEGAPNHDRETASVFAGSFASIEGRHIAKKRAGSDEYRREKRADLPHQRADPAHSSNEYRICRGNKPS
jgi:hypothetical protein